MNFKKYIDKAKEAYAEAYTNIDIETTSHKKAVADLKKHSTEYTEKAYGEHWNELASKYQDTLTSIEKKLSETVNAAGNELEADVTDFYTPKGSAIEEDDAKLLQSGIELSAEELQDLCTRNKQNMTMIRMVDQYLKRNRLDTSYAGSTVAYYIMLSKGAGEKEMQVWMKFKQLAGNAVRMAHAGYAGEDSYITCSDKLEEYAANCLQEFEHIYP